MSERRLRPDLDSPTVPRGDSGSSDASGWNLASLVREWLARDAAAGDDELSPRYQVRERLGRGGMGEVFRARDRRLRRDVALKTARLDAAERDGAGRFLHEAQVTAQLAHPNIPPLHDLGAGPDGSVFFTMRALPGRPLSQVLKEGGAQPVPRALEWFGKICDAVGYAHSRGVLHRDLKPGNLLVGDHGEVYVIDWGLARRITEDAAVRTDADDSGGALTEIGAVVGTPGYMSPEQLAGDVALDARADVYALGAVLYALLAGRPPFVGADPALRLKVHQGDYPRLRRLRPSVPWELDRVVDRALATRREDRYPSVDALQADLRALQEGRPLPGIRYPAWRRAAGVAGRWWRPLLGASAVGATLLGLGLAAVGYHALTVTGARDRAVLAEREARLRSLEQDVVLAQLGARLGMLSEARRALVDAGLRGEALGADPRRAAFALSALDGAYPPPDVRAVSPLPVVAVAFAGDRAAFAVTGDGSTTVSVHDLTSGDRLHRHTLPTDAGLVALRFDGPDGGLGAWVHAGSRLRRIDVATGLESAGVDLPDLPPAPTFLVSEDGRRVAVGDGRQTRFFAVPGGEPLGPAWPAVVDRLSADGRRAVGHAPVGGQHRQVIRFDWWDVDRGVTLGSAEGVGDGAFTADLASVVVADAGGVTARHGDRVDRWTQTPRQPWIVVDGDTAVLLGVEGLVQERAVATGEVRRWRGVGLRGDPGMRSLYVSGGWLAAPVVGAWHLWSRVDLAPLAAAGDSAPLSLDLSTDGALAATATWSGAVTVWEWRSRRPLLQVAPSPEGVRDAAFSPDGARLATADREGHVRVVDLRTREVGEPLDAARGIAMGVWWAPDGRLWASYEDGALVAWDPGQGRVVGTLRGDVTSAWNLEVAGGRAAVAGRAGGDPAGELWDLADGTRVLRTAAVGPAYGAAVADDGTAAAFGTADGRVIVVDPAGERAIQIPGAGPVLSLAFSPSGAELVAGTFAGRVVVLDPRSGEVLLDHEGHDDGVTEATFAPGTRTVLTLGGSRGELHALDLDGSRRLEETQLRIEVGRPAEDPWTTALARAELRRDWAHAAAAIRRGRALGEAPTPARAARAAQGTGDLAEAIRALRSGPDPEVSDATREIWAASLERALAGP